MCPNFDSAVHKLGIYGATGLEAIFSDRDLKTRDNHAMSNLSADNQSIEISVLWTTQSFLVPSPLCEVLVDVVAVLSIMMQHFQSYWYQLWYSPILKRVGLIALDGPLEVTDTQVPEAFDYNEHDRHHQVYRTRRTRARERSTPWGRERDGKVKLLSASTFSGRFSMPV